jgi:hypothetical protein
MSFLNFAMKELVFLFAYVGPPGSGKSTCLQYIKNKLPQQTYNPPLPLKHEEVDFLAPSVRAKNGFAVRLCLRVVPLEDLAFTNVDAIVLVLDSVEAGQVFASQLKALLEQPGRKEVPVAVQYNKRDDRSGSFPPIDASWMHFESSAFHDGVFEPLRELTKLLLARSK